MPNNYIAWMQRIPPEGKPVQEIVYKDKPKCIECGKPTTSHKIVRGDFSKVFACHGCFENATDEQREGWRKPDGTNSSNTSKEEKQKVQGQELETVLPREEPDKDSG